MSGKSADEMLSSIKTMTGLTDDDLGHLDGNDAALSAYYDALMESAKEQGPAPVATVPDTAADQPVTPQETVIPGFVEVAGKKVPLSDIVTYKGDPSGKKQHNILVKHPGSGKFYDVSFSPRPSLHPTYWTTVIRDYRIRAQVLFKVEHIKVSPTSRKTIPRVIPQREYGILDVNMPREDIKRMVDWLLHRDAKRLDEDELAARLIG